MPRESNPRDTRRARRERPPRVPHSTNFFVTHPAPVSPSRTTEGDRKAYFETSQWTMKQNKDTIASLKREYKELMAQLSEQNIGLGKTKENEVRLRTRHSRSRRLLLAQSANRPLRVFSGD